MRLFDSAGAHHRGGENGMANPGAGLPVRRDAAETRLAARGRPTIVGFDTEDGGKGDPFLWGFVHDSGNACYRSRADALDFLEKLGREGKANGRGAQVWATNLEYDLVNLFDRDRVVEVALRFGRSALVGASWRGVDFRDTVRHLPASVADLGELVGLPKLEADLFERGRPDTEADFNRYQRRCLRDAAITRRAAVRLWEQAEEFDQRPRMTLASTALNVWKTNYWKGETYRPNPDVYSAAFSAYHGGRTQAFALGEFADVTAIDVASMFPWAMVSRRFPLPWGLHRRVRRGEPVQDCGIYHVEIRSELERPRLPVRTMNGTIYPNGKWNGWYVGEELRAFVAAGGRARVLRGFEFLESCDPFTDYVGAMFEKKQGARGLARLYYKLMLNSLYGKFGQQGRVVRAVPLARFEKMRAAPTSWREWNGLAIFSKEGAPPPWGNMVWPAFVTARARVRLAAELDRLAASDCRPLYCDTDSVMFQGEARYPETAPRIGAFERRGHYGTMLIVGKKEYALALGGGKWDVHAKGVPFVERMRYLREGVAEFERPTRIRESARTGNKANVWRRVRKQRHVTSRTVPQADGTLPVERIDA